MKDKTANGILDEITTFCGNECSSVYCCPENERILFRIEKLLVNEPESPFEYGLIKEGNTIKNCCFRSGNESV